MRRYDVVRIVEVIGSFIARDTEGKRSDYHSGEVTFEIEYQQHFFRLPVQEWLNKNKGRIKWGIRHIDMKEDAQDIYDTFKIISVKIDIINVVESKVKL